MECVLKKASAETMRMRRQFIELQRIELERHVTGKSRTPPCIDWLLPTMPNTMSLVTSASGRESQLNDRHETTAACPLPIKHNYLSAMCRVKKRIRL
ncbi:hypothetical protein GDI0978 [Gluconacetobacter diazotrophicus PA1 5]|uniref:Uncharacterized protein n=1 Tax=Gluconacetobacter diazotrophicus (strain ATCC 49037 / DSM 5601 / CCUG 37298 / CIP 103539 / LMG 7603 / PAl5) TaxID=272568 RepID=A9HCA7_GLUDA|nr:hypothetical protein GDI0978 [Gluconacetobacter diazotrophicus PA1 5]